MKTKQIWQALGPHWKILAIPFEYGGGAVGPQTFGEEIKEEFMKKHPVK